MLISQNHELRISVNSATHMFTRLERLLTISDRGRIAGVCCPNQIKNHHYRDMQYIDQLPMC